VVNPTDMPFWQAASPRPRATWVLPVVSHCRAIGPSDNGERAQGDDVLAPVDPFAPGEFQDLRLVEPGDRLEVEAVQALGDRERAIGRHWSEDNGERRLDAPLHHAPLPVDQLELDQSGQEPDVVQTFGRALAGELVVLP
jgi:hypothetical protein